ncbi:MAG: hypothetical protein ACFE9L_14270 [Candidatus Hodarchaeota archaeon]
MWEKTYKKTYKGIYDFRYLYAVQTSDGGVVCGYLMNEGGLWIAKIDGNGEVKWEQTYDTWRWL